MSGGTQQDKSPAKRAMEMYKAMLVASAKEGQFLETLKLVQKEEFDQTNFDKIKEAIDTIETKKDYQNANQVIARMVLESKGQKPSDKEVEKLLKSLKQVEPIMAAYLAGADDRKLTSVGASTDAPPKAVKDEYATITGTNPPKWFAALSKPAQALLKEMVQTDDYSFLKFQSSTFRGLPGLTGLRAQQGLQEGDHVNMSHGFVVPFDMVGVESDAEVQRQTELNIKTSIAAAIKQQLAKEPPGKVDRVFLQNLVTLSTQPQIAKGGAVPTALLNATVLLPVNVLRGAGNLLFRGINALSRGLGGKFRLPSIPPLIQSKDRNTSRIYAKAIEQVKEELDGLSGEDLGAELADYGVTEAEKVKLRSSLGEGEFALSTGSTAVNKGRAANANGPIAQFLLGLVGVDLPLSLIDDNLGNAQQMRALAKSDQVNEETALAKLWVAYDESPGDTFNTNARKAALERVINPVRIGSCVSGKDREYMTAVLARAMSKVCADNPDTFKGHIGESELAAINELVNEQAAEIFVKDYQAYMTSQATVTTDAAVGTTHTGATVADLMAPGAEGIKNIGDVFGKGITTKIDQKFNGLADDDPAKNMTCKLIEKKAGLNKTGEIKPKDHKKWQTKRSGVFGALQALKDKIGGVFGHQERDTEMSVFPPPADLAATTEPETTVTQGAEPPQKPRQETAGYRQAQAAYQASTAGKKKPGPGPHTEEFPQSDKPVVLRADKRDKGMPRI